MRRSHARLLAVWTGCFLATPSTGQTHCEGLLPLRAAFMKHSTMEQALQTEADAVEWLNTLDEKTPVECRVAIEAHRWVSLARSADFGWNPAQKLARLNQGLGGLDSLSQAHPDLDVVRALRLSVTGTAPRFLGIDDQWENDLLALRRLLMKNHWQESPTFSEWMRDLAEQIERERT